MVDLLGEVPVVEQSPPGRWIDLVDPRLRRTLTLVLLTLPVFAYFWVIHRYSVNVIFGDQWSDITVIAHPSWTNLWAQHNENRIFFPNLVMLVLAHTTHLNTVVENYLSAVMLTVAVGLLIWAHHRRSQTPWLYYFPFVALVFSWVQVGNALWGFQMAWYLLLLALGVSIALIDRPTLTWLVLCGAITAGIVGSFSSLQGLLIWPAGLILIYLRRRPMPFVLAWVGAAIITTIVYFYGYTTKQGFPSYRYALDHPLASAKFYVFSIGDVAGIPYHGNGTVVVLLGLVILALAAYVLITAKREGGGPIGVTLIMVGFLFALLTTEGRSFLGYLGAGQSRYTTFDLLVPLGIYLVLLEPAKVPVRCLTGAVFVMLIALGYTYGLEGARQGHTNDVAAVHVLRNIDREPNAAVSAALDPGYPAPRHQAQIAEDRHLSLFAP